MRLHFVTPDASPLADPSHELIDGLRAAALAVGMEVAKAPEEADVVVLHEAFSFKEHRYVRQLTDDPIVARFAHKLCTINFDDCATGLLRGLYSSIPRSRFDARLHAAIPYFTYHNALVFSAQPQPVTQGLLAAWRGNASSHPIRCRMIELFADDPRFAIEPTESWYNHGEDEKARYVSMILSAPFSLCPGGIAPVSFRIFESMALGRAPVLIADDYVYPAQLDWPSFSLQIPERSIGELGSLLAAQSGRAAQLGRAAREAWDAHFSRSRIFGYLLGEIARLVRHAPPSTAAQEIGRWDAWSTWHANGWTLPQRAARNLKRTVLARLPGAEARLV